MSGSLPTRPAAVLLNRTGTALAFGLAKADAWWVALAVAPLLAGLVIAKTAKVLLGRPLLTPVNFAEVGLRLGTSAIVKLALFLAAGEVVRRRWFRTWSAAWTPVVCALGFVAAKGLWSLRTGSFTLGGSVILTQAKEEVSFLWAAFRADILVACVCFAATALIVRCLRSVGLGGRLLPARWSVWIFALPLLFSGLELAYFRKTGLGGRLDLIALALGQTPGMVGLAASEVDWQSVVLVLTPLVLGMAAYPLLARFRSERGVERSTAPLTLGLAGIAGFLLVVPPPRVLPEHARFTDNPLVSVVADLSGGATRGQSWTHARGVAATSPLLFDPRIATEAGKPPSRNVVLVMMESMRASATSFHAPFPATTPFLKELASRGAMVTDMYAVAPRTSASWVAILNGIYPGDSDMLFLWGAEEAKAPRAVSLPQALRRYGYRSGFFLPTHLVLQNDEQIVANFGFDDVIRLRLDQDRKPVSDSVFRDPFDIVSFFGYEDRVLLDPTRAWVRSQVAAQRPFFLAIMTNVGHYPYTPPKGFAATTYREAPTQEYNDYLNSIAYVDAYLKDLFSIFRQESLLDSTVFIFVGDHGESFGEHGPRQHMGQAYEEVLRVPAVLVGPGVEPGSTVGGLRQQIDIVPTVFDLLGIRLTGGRLPGRSLLAPADSGRRLYFNGVYEATTLAAREGSTKYLYNFGRWPTEVYDLIADPNERQNLASDKPQAVAEVERDLQIWHEAVRRALLAPN